MEPIPGDLRGEMAQSGHQNLATTSSYNDPMQRNFSPPNSDVMIQNAVKQAMSTVSFPSIASTMDIPVPIISNRPSLEERIAAQQSAIPSAALGSSPDSYTCPKCSETFPDSYVFFRHLQSHSGERNYKCDVSECGMYFKSKQEFQHHMAAEHQDQKYFCNQCGKNFVWKSSFYQHNKIYHRKELKHHCETCGQAFAKPSQLKAHMVKHSEVSEFQCDECGKAFKSKAYLKQHMKTSTHNKNQISATSESS